MFEFTARWRIIAISLLLIGPSLILVPAAWSVASVERNALRAKAAASKEWYVPSDHVDGFRAGKDCIVVADRRIFAVMSFINAIGFDDQAQNTPMHPVRMKVREMLRVNL